MIASKQKKKKKRAFFEKHTMSVLVGASSNNKFPTSTTNTTTTTTSPYTVSDMGNTRDQPGPSGDNNLQANLHRQFSKSSICESEEEDFEHEESVENKSFVVSPIVPLKDQLEKDRDDESLRRWKEQLLGSVLLDPLEECIEPEVRVLNLSIQSLGRPDIVIALPLQTNLRGHLFTLKEGSTYKIKFTFTVHRNIVSGLTYIHTVWKNGFRVDNTKIMLGTFGPKSDPYTYVTDEETTPSGILARGSYTSRTRFVDDDGRSHLEIQHTFGICKDW